jgi:hypothetical protein
VSDQAEQYDCTVHTLGYSVTERSRYIDLFEVVSSRLCHDTPYTFFIL